MPTKNVWDSVKKTYCLEDAPLETQRLLWALWFTQVGYTSIFHLRFLCAILQVNIFHLLKMQSTEAESKLCLYKFNHWYWFF